MKYNKLTKFVQNKVNPFAHETVHHIEKGEKQIIYTTKDPDLIVDSDGNVRGHSVMARKVKVDRAQFTKIYMTGLANWYDLSKSAIKMFAYIANSISPNSDEFYFDLDECKEFTGYNAKNTIFNGLAELVENRFIARGKNPYHYFINPTIFFNGDRLTLLEQYEVDTEEPTQPHKGLNGLDDDEPPMGGIFSKGVTLVELS